MLLVYICRFVSVVQSPIYINESLPLKNHILCFGQFPECTEENGVSVSCLGLHYSVTMRTQRVKDEKKDNTVPVVLKRLSSQDTTDDLKNTSGKYKI